MPKLTLGTCRLINKEHFPARMYSYSTKGTQVTTTEGWWLPNKLPECSAPKNWDNSLKTHLCCPYIPPTLCISITFVTSLNDVMIVCFPLPVGKSTVHAQESCAGLPAHLLVSLPAVFLQLCMDHLVNSISQISSLWHSPQGIWCALIPEPKIY